MNHHSVLGWAFLEAIAQHAPAVLADLAGEPYRQAVAWHATDDPRLWNRRQWHRIMFDTACREWAARYNTPELVVAGYFQCLAWLAKGQADTSAWNMPHLTSEGVPPQAEPMVYDFRYALTIDATTDLDTAERDLIAAFRAETAGHFGHYAALTDEFKRLHWSTYTASRKTATARHLHWLVRFQICGEAMGAIARDLKDAPRRRDAQIERTDGRSDQGTVSRGIRDTATRVGIALRPRHNSPTT